MQKDNHFIGPQLILFDDKNKYFGEIDDEVLKRSGFGINIDED